MVKNESQRRGIEYTKFRNDDKHDKNLVDKESNQMRRVRKVYTYSTQTTDERVLSSTRSTSSKTIK